MLATGSGISSDRRGCFMAGNGKRSCIGSEPLQPELSAPGGFLI